MKLAVYDFPTGTKRTGRFEFTRGEGRGYESEPIRALAFSPRGDRLAAAGSYGDVPVWATTNWKLQYLERGHRHTVRSVAVSPDGGELLSIGDGAALLRWPLARPREPVVRPLDFRQAAPPLSASLVSPAVACSHDGKTIVITWHSGIAVRNTVTEKETAISAAPAILQNPAVSPDGRTVAAGGGDGYLHLWDLALGKDVHRYPIKGRWCGLAFSLEGGFLASCNEEKKRVTIWNATTGNESCSWEVQSAMRVSAFDPHGKVLATGHEDGSILLWDTATGQKIRALAGHSARIDALKFTPDGKTLVSSGDDGTLRLWNPEHPRAREIISLGPANRPLVFDLDPSGKYLFAAGQAPVIFILRRP
jgi:WD40 repeat protein